jgi:hypothetical protein
MEPENSFPHLQAPVVCPYPKPDQSSPFVPTPLLEKSLVKEGNMFYSSCKKYHWPPVRVQEIQVE